MPAVGRREAGAALDLVAADPSRGDSQGDAPNTAAMIETLQATMSDNVGPLRKAPRLEYALRTIAKLSDELERVSDGFCWCNEQVAKRFIPVFIEERSIAGDERDR